VWFFGFVLGCFPVAVAVWQVGLFLVNQHGAMLAWAVREQKTMLATLFFRGLGVLVVSKLKIHIAARLGI